MCNEAARRIALDLIREDFAELRIPLRFPEGLPNLAATASVRITDPTLIVRPASDGSPQPEAVQRRWSWAGTHGRPVYNVRSEGRRLDGGAGHGRCLIPVDGFYEFTAPGEPRQKHKTRWLFTHSAEPWFCIAGMWRATPGVAGSDGERFAMLTTEPGPDVAPYHPRQVVIVPRDGWARWLDPRAEVGDLTAPAPAGTLSVARVG